MKTIECLMNQLTSPEILNEILELLRNNDPDFSAEETACHEAIDLLRSCSLSPTIDEYIVVCGKELNANVLYAASLGFRANLMNFRLPYTLDFTQLDFSDYLREHLSRGFPVHMETQKIKESFLKNLPEDFQSTHENIAEYFMGLDVVVPKLTHYAGYLFANLLLPYVEPGYQVDLAQTFRYKRELRKFFPGMIQ